MKKEKIRKIFDRGVKEYLKLQNKKERMKTKNNNKILECIWLIFIFSSNWIYFVIITLITLTNKEDTMNEFAIIMGSIVTGIATVIGAMIFGHFSNKKISKNNTLEHKDLEKNNTLEHKDLEKNLTMQHKDLQIGITSQHKAIYEINDYVKKEENKNDTLGKEFIDSINSLKNKHFSLELQFQNLEKQNVELVKENVVLISKNAELSDEVKELKAEIKKYKLEPEKDKASKLSM